MQKKQEILIVRSKLLIITSFYLLRIVKQLKGKEDYLMSLILVTANSIIYLKLV
jgi:hypothetical protein